MQKYSQNNHHQTNTKKKRRNPTKKNQTATKRNRGTPKTKQQKTTKKVVCENPSKNIRVVLWNETHRFEKPNPIVLRIIKKITANLPITYKENEPRFVRHSINAHVEPRLIFIGKSTHKIKATKQNQEKVESNHKKVEKQAKRQQERAKNRSETNKGADSDPGAEQEWT